MSTLPPLPPEYQAKVDRNYREAVDLLSGFVAGLRRDPKRNPDDVADYHNTVYAMLVMAERDLRDTTMTRTMCALACIIVADSGWAPDPGADPRGDAEPDAPESPSRAEVRAELFNAGVVRAEPAAEPGATEVSASGGREGRHMFAAWWLAVFLFLGGAVFLAGVATALWRYFG